MSSFARGSGLRDQECEESGSEGFGAEVGRVAFGQVHVSARRGCFGGHRDVCRAERRLELKNSEPEGPDAVSVYCVWA